MKTVTSKLISILLVIGAVGYLVGATGWSLFWLRLAQIGGRPWAFLGYVGFPLSALSLGMAGLGCFALGRFFRKWLAILTGVVCFATAVPFSLMNNLLALGGYKLYDLVLLPGFGLLISSLFLWALTVWDITRFAHHKHSAQAIYATSIIAAVIFLLLLGPALYWGPIMLTIYTQPYVLMQILSAILLLKIRTDTNQH